MHTIQFNYDYLSSCGDYFWLEEATANWAIDYVYPTNNFEHGSAHAFFKFEYAHPLEEGTDFGTNGYADYLYLLFLSKTYGADLIKDIWDETEVRTSIEAVDAAAPAGIEGDWAQFGLDLVNRPPANFFQQKDAIPFQWDVLHRGCCVRLALRGAQLARFPLNFEEGPGHWCFDCPALFELPHLATRLVGIDVEEDAVRRISLANPFSGQAHVELHAWLQMHDGQTKTVDWSDRSTIRLCRDRPDENVDRVILVWSNAAKPPSDTLFFPRQYKVTAGADCLPDRFAGTFGGSYTHTGGGFEEPTLTWTGTITWKRAAASCIEFWCLENGYQGYAPETGLITWSMSGGDVGGCSVTGSGQFAVALNTSQSTASWLEVQRHAATGHGRLHHGRLGTQQLLDVTFHCPSGDFTGQTSNSVWWLVSTDDHKEGSVQGDVLSGHIADGPGPNGDVWTFDWSFSPAD
jgi:hypothetical protein